VSGYGLIAQPGTPLGADPARHPEADNQADEYELLDETLEAAGYSWYEISNWARPGAACRHNQLYWAQGEYRGFGCAAHSHEVRPDATARRWWNVRTPERYLRCMAEGTGPVGGAEILGADQRATEALELAVRTVSGVALADLPDGAERELEMLVGLGLVELFAAGADPLTAHRGPRLRLTRRGRLLASEVTLHLLGPSGQWSGGSRSRSPT
jgi:oxygen-independent coproporphyrinogen-3 oxidase